MPVDPLSPHPEAPDDLPPRPLRHHLALSLYWLSNSLMWGVLLQMGLQSRLSDWFDQDRVGYFIGLIGFIGGLLGMTAQLVAGALSDRSQHPAGRRRPFLCGGATVAAVALVLLGQAKSFAPFLGAMVLLQIAANAALAPFTALLPDTVNPREHGKASGLMGAARLLGDIGGLVLAGMLLSPAVLGDATHAEVVAFHDQRMALLCALMAGFMVAMMALTCVTVRERALASTAQQELGCERRRGSAPAPRWGRGPQTPCPPEQADAGHPPGSAWAAVFGAFRLDLRAHPDFAWLSLSRAVTNFGFYIFLGVLFFFIKFTLGDPDPHRATMLVMLPAIIAAAAASAPAGLLSDRLGRRKIILVSQLVLAAAGAIFLVAPNLTVALIAGIPAGIAFGAFASVEWAFACNLLPKAESGRYLGIWNISAVVPQLLALPIAGALGSGVSSLVPGLGWRIDFGLSVVCCLLGAWLLRYVRERRG